MVASALTVKVMEIQTSVAPSDIRLRDDLENGYGFRLAMSNVGWLVTQKFVILVPDPIGESLDSCLIETPRAQCRVGRRFGK